MLPQLFKGIALFTPGGDLIYCIDPNKQGRWHLHLCVGLQEILGLAEPPHFLVPGYTATVDRWLDTETQQIRTLAEVYPPVQRYKALLSAVFGVDELIWQIAPWQEESCNPIILENYRHKFAQLWENHDLIVAFETEPKVSSLELEQLSSRSNYRNYSQQIRLSQKRLFNKEGSSRKEFNLLSPNISTTTPTYVLRLFVSFDRASTEQTLEKIHQILEQGLGLPYTLKVIDISKHPDLAETNQVSATPTLVRVWPHPVRRIVGELEDIDRVLEVLTTF
ncbi:MAG: circadian clock KaiB family protein [Prochloraceae cyanobacterium]|nr:circadian clock KaiB family protein [Prochloraceae cyanobacterium]